MTKQKKISPLRQGGDTFSVFILCTCEKIPRRSGGYKADKVVWLMIFDQLSITKKNQMAPLKNRIKHLFDVVVFSRNL
jgi:hypothetical protein